MNTDRKIPHLILDTDVERVLSPALVIEEVAAFVAHVSKNPLATSPRVRTDGDYPIVASVGSTNLTAGARLYGQIGNDDAATVLWDRDTGRVRGVHIGNRLGELRTAGCNAFAAMRILEGTQVSQITSLGAGAQARGHLRMLHHLWPDAQIRIWSRTRNRAELLAREFASAGIAASSFSSSEDAVSEADIVVSATNACTPIVALEALLGAKLILAIGPKNISWHELPGGIVEAADLLTTDSESQLVAYPGPTIFDGVRDTVTPLVRLKPSPPGSLTLHISVGLPGAEIALLERVIQLVTS